MRGVRLDRPPRWGLVLLVIAVVGNIVLFSVLSLNPPDPGPLDSRPAAATATQAPASTSSHAPSSAAAGSSAAVPARTVLAVYGDGYAAGNDEGGEGPAGWPALVARRTGAELALHAVSRCGYAAVGAGGQDLLGLVRSAPVGDASLTVLFGSRNDAGQDLRQVQANARQAVDVVRRQAPGSALLMIGPVWSDGSPPDAVLEVRDTLRNVASDAGVPFVDPLAEGWFAEPTDLISADGVSPTDAGHEVLAELIVPVVQVALSAATPAVPGE